MPTTDQDTVRNLVEDAHRKIGVAAFDEPLTDDQARNGVRALNRMVKGWQNKGYSLWAKAAQSVTLTGAAVYVLDPKRPMEILSCRFKQNGVERPMLPFTRDEYDSLPVKDSKGTPTTYYYDRQREEARLYIWPLLFPVTAATLEITYTREFEDMDLNDEPDVPVEWYDAVVYNLAARLADDYRVDPGSVPARAQKELFDALAYDREDSIWFHEPR